METTPTDTTHYAGFWRRAFAAGIDSVLVFLGPGILYFRASPVAFRIGSIVSGLLFHGYEIYFHARWGRTLGKMVLGTKVVRLDGSPIDLRASFLRNSVDLAFAGIDALIAIGLLWQLDAFHSHPTAQTIGDAFENFSLNPLTDRLYTAWVIGEALVLLFNRKKRAIHDFIAGTVVVRMRKSSPTFRTAS